VITNKTPQSGVDGVEGRQVVRETRELRRVGIMLSLVFFGKILLELQPKLLRALQEGESERLGRTGSLRTCAWLVAATKRDLMVMVMDQLTTAIDICAVGHISG
jgi:Sigma-54 interaction domain